MSNLPTDPHPTSEEHETGLRAIVVALRRVALVVLVVGAASLGLVGCGDDDEAGTGTDPLRSDEPTGGQSPRDLVGAGAAPELEIRAADDGSFEPERIRVGAGATVQLTFENEGSTDHTFTMEELDIDELVEPGGVASIEVSFPDTGTYEFVCRIHEDDGMRGEFEVVEGDDDASTTTELTEGSGDPGSGSAPEGGTVPLDPGGEGGEGAETDAENEDSSAGGVGSES